MDKEFIHGQTAQNTRENGKMLNLMDLEFIHFPMEEFHKEYGKILN